MKNALISWFRHPEAYLGYADVLPQATKAAENACEGLAGLEGEVELVGARVAEFYAHAGFGDQDDFAEVALLGETAGDAAEFFVVWALPALLVG